MPVYYAQYPYPSDEPRAGFKAGVIQGMQASHAHGYPLAGVGDRPSDMKAYATSDLATLIITDALGEVGNERIHKAKLEAMSADLPDACITYYRSSPEATAWAQLAQALSLIADEYEAVVSN